MFTGIVEEVGKIFRLSPSPDGIRMTVSTNMVGFGTRPGDSIAVNGCCLTVANISKAPTNRKRSMPKPSTPVGSPIHLAFDLLKETWSRTSFALLKESSLVNLERALPADGRFGGHFVTGHIDTVGFIRRWEPVGNDHVLEIESPRAFRKYLVPKGSIAVDGISLTIADLVPKGFRLWIIPHTLMATQLRQKKLGESVNLEFDLLAKYVEKMVPHPKSG